MVHSIFSYFCLYISFWIVFPMPMKNGIGSLTAIEGNLYSALLVKKSFLQLILPIHGQFSIPSNYLVILAH